MKFDELVFVEHPMSLVAPGAIRSQVQFPNGYGASIVGGWQGLYGDGVRTFELAVTHGQGTLCYSTPVTSDVLGWRTKEEIEEALSMIEALPVNEHCDHKRPPYDWEKEDNDNDATATTTDE